MSIREELHGKDGISFCLQTKQLSPYTLCIYYKVFVNENQDKQRKNLDNLDNRVSYDPALKEAFCRSLMEKLLPESIGAALYKKVIVGNSFFAAHFFEIRQSTPEHRGSSCRKKIQGTEYQGLYRVAEFMHRGSGGKIILFLVRDKDEKSERNAAYIASCGFYAAMIELMGASY